jgi:hypothetical protein
MLRVLMMEMPPRVTVSATSAAQVDEIFLPTVIVLSMEFLMTGEFSVKFIPYRRNARSRREIFFLTISECAVYEHSARFPAPVF